MHIDKSGKNAVIENRKALRSLKIDLLVEIRVNGRPFLTFQTWNPWWMSLIEALKLFPDWMASPVKWHRCFGHCPGCTIQVDPLKNCRSGAPMGWSGKWHRRLHLTNLPR